MTVTCLGCGCGCDDLTVRVREGRIVELSPPCPMAQQWFGDGTVPAEIQVEGRTASIEQAIEKAAALLSRARRPAVLIAPDLTTQAQRIAIAAADLLRAEVDGATSEAAAAGLLAAQRRGRSASTLGEIRNRADVILFWAVDPRERYPRYLERYAPAEGLHVQQRATLSVSVGADRGPGGAEIAAEFVPAEESDALAVMVATVRGQRLGELPATLHPAVALAGRLMQGRYIAIVHDAEPGREARDVQRAEGLVALAQALNDGARSALSSLRAGGNRSGAEAALTWQTGYPMRVSYREGSPAYAAGASGISRALAADAVLVAGSAAALGDSAFPLDRIPAVVIGPAASTLKGAKVAIDTGVAGIHEPGIGYRMDDVPLPLTPVLPTPRGAAETLMRLLGALRAGSGRKAP